MYAARSDIHPEFCSLVRFAPVAVNSGLRPETRFGYGATTLTVTRAGYAAGTKDAHAG